MQKPKPLIIEQQRKADARMDAAPRNRTATSPPPGSRARNKPGMAIPEYPGLLHSATGSIRHGSDGQCRSPSGENNHPDASYAPRPRRGDREFRS